MTAENRLFAEKNHVNNRLLK